EHGISCRAYALQSYACRRDTQIGTSPPRIGLLLCFYGVWLHQAFRRFLVSIWHIQLSRQVAMPIGVIRLMGIHPKSASSIQPGRSSESVQWFSFSPNILRASL